MERMPTGARVHNSVRAILLVSVALSIEAQPANGTSGSGAVLQIFAEQCVKCHNAKQSAGQLRLDSFEGLAAGGASGTAVVPGQSVESNVYKRITATDAALRMPPAVAPLSRPTELARLSSGSTPEQRDSCFPEHH